MGGLAAAAARRRPLSVSQPSLRRTHRARNPRRPSPIPRSRPVMTRAAPDAFDLNAYEAERLREDAKAMAHSKQIAESIGETEGTDESPSAWKWPIRKRIWDMLEAENLAAEPRPVHHRIPNFVTAAEAAATFTTLPEFQAGRCIKVNPDTPQKPVRMAVLSEGKLLMTPQPRLRTGFFSTIDGTAIEDAQLRKQCCTSAGVAQHGAPLTLDADIKVDMVVVGSVAVDPNTGARLGKGEGFAELEYGMLRYMGAIDESTLVVTTVHDEQLVNDIPLDKMLKHDVPVDVICTPTRIIRIQNSPIPKPTGIYWDMLSKQKLGQIRVLQELKRRIEEETGEALPTGPDEILPPTAARSNFNGQKGGRGGSGRRGRGKGRGKGGGKGGGGRLKVTLKDGTTLGGSEAE